MTLVIHDLSKEEAAAFDFKESRVISDNGRIRNCIGCFGCWVKTPGQCVIHDGYENVGSELSKCSRLIIISRCAYGCYSPFVKNVLDRIISYVHPCFEIRNGEMHHKRRYDNEITVDLYMYGSGITEDERKTAEGIVRANAVNFDGKAGRIAFAENAQELGGELIC